MQAQSLPYSSSQVSIKNITFSENLQMAAFELWFFLQVSELDKKLDELSLKDWIGPCGQHIGIIRAFCFLEGQNNWWFWFATEGSAPRLTLWAASPILLMLTTAHVCFVLKVTTSLITRLALKAWLNSPVSYLDICWTRLIFFENLVWQW